MDPDPSRSKTASTAHPGAVLACAARASGGASIFLLNFTGQADRKHAHSRSSRR